MKLSELDLILERSLGLKPKQKEYRHLQSSLDFLNSEKAMAAFELDAYWPKWTNPWWHMLLLFEMGKAELIPRSIANKLVESLNMHCIKFFPIKEEELPAGIDPFRNIPCHCQLGCMYQVLHACGCNVDKELGWISPWFLRYQLADGGLNCDESVYTRPVPRSSVVSTLPPLEAVLYCTGRELSHEERRFLDAGAEYLTKRQLCRSLSKAEIIDETWLKLAFPRFYHYDILRGLKFLVDYSLRFHIALPLRAVADAIACVDSAVCGSALPVARNVWQGAGSRCLDPVSGLWQRGTSESFPLLEELSEIGAESPSLTRHWLDALSSLRQLRQKGLLVAD